MFEKFKIDSFKKEIIDVQQKSINNHLEQQLVVFKSNCDTLISKSYGNSRTNIEKLEKEN